MDWKAFLDSEVSRRDQRQKTLWTMTGYAATLFGAVVWYILNFPEDAGPGLALEEDAMGADMARVAVVCMGIGGLVFSLLVAPRLRRFVRDMQPVLGRAGGGSDQTALERFLEGWEARRVDHFRFMAEGLGYWLGALMLLALSVETGEDGNGSGSLAVVALVLAALGAVLIAFPHMRETIGAVRIVPARWRPAGRGFDLPPSSPGWARRSLRYAKRAGWALLSLQGAAYALVFAMLALTLATETPLDAGLKAAVLSSGAIVFAAVLGLAATKLYLVATGEGSRRLIERIRYALVVGELSEREARAAYEIVETLRARDALRHVRYEDVLQAVPRYAETVLAPPLVAVKAS